MAIFIVDDDIFYTSIIEKQLENCQMTDIQTFHAMEDALTGMKQSEPSVVFLDLHLHDVKVIDRFDRIKKEFPNTYLVAMTASEDDGLKEECFQKGAFYFLNKNKDLYQNIKNLFIEINKYSEYFH